MKCLRVGFIRFGRSQCELPRARNVARRHIFYSTADEAFGFAALTCRILFFLWRGLHTRERFCAAHPTPGK